MSTTQVSGDRHHGLAFLVALSFLVCLGGSILAAEPALPPPASTTASTNLAFPLPPQLDAETRLAVIFADWDHLIADWEESWDDVGPGLVSYIDEARLILQTELQRIRRSRQSELAELRTQLALSRRELPGAESVPPSRVATETNRPPVPVLLASLVPDERVWTMSGHLRDFVGNWIDQEEKHGVDLVFLLQQPLRLFHKELKRIDEEHRRDIAGLRAELTALQANAQINPGVSTNSMARPSVTPSPVPR